MAQFPWWIALTAAFGLVEYHNVLMKKRKVSSEGNRNLFIDARRLKEGFLLTEGKEGFLQRLPPVATPGKAGADGLPSSFNVSLPCSLNFFNPCGNVTVGSNPVWIHSPFGAFQIGSVSEDKQFSQAFGGVTLVLCVVGGVIFILVYLVVPSKRQVVMKQITDTMKGKIDDDDGPLPPTPEQKADEERERYDPKSDKFIAPGNIYRFLAVLHPGEIGWQMWIQYATEAGLVAYMQLYLPASIISGIFEHWEYNGVKSPFWFCFNGVAFVTQFAALASLCRLFQQKCSENIRVGAGANLFILTHKKPGPPPPEPMMPVEDPHQDGGLWWRGWGGGGSMDDQQGYAGMPNMQNMQTGDPQSMQSLQSDMSDGSTLLNHAPDSLLEPLKPEFPEWMIMWNEFLWCYLSLCMNCMMTLLLLSAMFLKIFTYTGAIDEVAIITLSLYFVFDLDDKLMDGDPKLRPMYRRAVLQQTEVRADDHWHPTYIMPLAGVAIGISKLILPMGILGLFLFSWRNIKSNVVIGGDPWELGPT